MSDYNDYNSMGDALDIELPSYDDEDISLTDKEMAEILGEEAEKHDSDEILTVDDIGDEDPLNKKNKKSRKNPREQLRKKAAQRQMEEEQALQERIEAEKAIQEQAGYDSVTENTERMPAEGSVPTVHEHQAESVWEHTAVSDEPVWEASRPDTSSVHNIEVFGEDYTSKPDIGFIDADEHIFDREQAVPSSDGEQYAAGHQSIAESDIKDISYENQIQGQVENPAFVMQENNPEPVAEIPSASDASQPDTSSVHNIEVFGEDYSSKPDIEFLGPNEHIFDREQVIPSDQAVETTIPVQGYESVPAKSTEYENISADQGTAEPAPYYDNNEAISDYREETQPVGNEQAYYDEIDYSNIDISYEDKTYQYDEQGAVSVQGIDSSEMGDFDNTPISSYDGSDSVGEYIAREETSGAGTETFDYTHSEDIYQTENIPYSDMHGMGIEDISYAEITPRDEEILSEMAESHDNPNVNPSDIGVNSLYQESFESFNPTEQGFYDKETTNNEVHNIGGMSDLKNIIDEMESRSIENITVPYHDAEIMANEVTYGKIIADTGETATRASINREISGTHTDEGFYEGCNIIPADANPLFDSRAESSVLQPEKSSSEEIGFIKEDNAYSEEHTSNIIGCQHNGHYSSDPSIFETDNAVPKGHKGAASDKTTVDSYSNMPAPKIIPKNTEANQDYAGKQAGTEDIYRKKAVEADNADKTGFGIHPDVKTADTSVGTVGKKSEPASTENSKIDKQTIISNTSPVNTESFRMSPTEVLLDPRETASISSYTSPSSGNIDEVFVNGTAPEEKEERISTAKPPVIPPKQVVGVTATGDKLISPDKHKNTAKRAENKDTGKDTVKKGVQQLKTSRTFEKHIRQKFKTGSHRLVNTVSKYSTMAMKEAALGMMLGGKDSETREGYEKVKKYASMAKNLAKLGLGSGLMFPGYLGAKSAVMMMTQKYTAIARASEGFVGLMQQNTGLNISSLTKKKGEEGLGLKDLKKDFTDKSKSIAKKIGLENATYRDAKKAFKDAVAKNDRAGVLKAKKKMEDSRKKIKNARKKQKELRKGSKDIRIINKYKKDVYDALRGNQILLNTAKANPNLFSERQLKHIQKGKFIKGAVYKNQNIAILGTYLSNSKNQLLRTLNPSRMSVRDIKKILRKKKKYVITADERHALNMLVRLKKAPSISRLGILKNGIMGRIGGIVGLSKAFIQNVEDDTIKTAGTAYRGSVVALKMISFTARQGFKVIRFVGRPIFRPIGRFLRNKRQLAKQIAKESIKKTARSFKVTLSKSKPGKFVRRKVTQVKNTQFAKTVSSGLKTTKNTVKTVAKAGRKAAKTTRKVASVVATPFKAAFNVIAAPFRAVSFIKRIIAKIIKWIALVLAILIMAYIILLLLTSLLFISTDGVKEASKYPIMESDDIKLKIDYLNELNDKKYEDALKVAKGTPMTQDVFGGEKIYHYGSPSGKDDPLADIYHNDISDEETGNGYHIYFIDSKGDVIGSNTTNTKDIISLTAVMMEDDLYKENSNELKDDFNELIEEWSKLLNPNVTYIESDIYHAEGSDVFPHGELTSTPETYYCNDPDYAEKYNKYVWNDERVNGQTGRTKFYTYPHTPRTPFHNGCTVDYESWADAMTEWSYLAPEAPEEPDWDDYVYMDEPDYYDYDDEDEYYYYYELYWSLVDAYNEAYDRYLNDFNNYQTEYDEFLETRPDTHDYIYCPGHPNEGGWENTSHRYRTPDGTWVYSFGSVWVNPTPVAECSYGYRDINVFVTVLTKDDVFEAFQNNNGVIKYKVPKKYDMSQWENKTVDIKHTQVGHNKALAGFLDAKGWKSESNRAWVDMMMDSDWYDAFGVDVYREGVGLSDGSGSLSPRQIQELLDSYKDEISSDREQFVSFALNYVGQIDYYYGGKPDCEGFAGNNFGERLEVKDGKGRNIRGLDCSGFVGWVYWSTFHEKPKMTTSGFVSSLRLRKTTADKLIPGDIGYMNEPGASSENHMGIFVGYDPDTGKAKWVHCMGKPTDNVVCNTTNAFRYYYSLGK